MRAGGFTLIEMMITIAIFGILLFIGVPLTKAWSDSANQRDAAGLLKQGISRAKATALRNPGAALDNAPAAVLCRSGQTLKLFSLANAQSINCASTSNILWTAQMPASTSALAAGAEIACVAFSSSGLAVVGGNACTTTSIDVIVGSENALNVLII
ncbi:MAG TPA: prepilin-type N-terminal cleavage/methylation domain-containing protein [Pseudomonas sp.]|jgi:prepilin-type N-terminal cleavage/methylation domain-containing protein